jgi:tRNA A37 threonylcarbamoyladenosine dehydratase
VAETLAKLGLRRFTLIDPDEVDTVNLAVQWFYERGVGRTKTSAVADRIAAIDSQTKAATWAQPHEALSHAPEEGERLSPV